MGERQRAQQWWHLVFSSSSPATPLRDSFPPPAMPSLQFIPIQLVNDLRKSITDLFFSRGCPQLPSIITVDGNLHHFSYCFSGKYYYYYFPSLTCRIALDNDSTMIALWMFLGMVPPPGFRVTAFTPHHRNTQYSLVFYVLRYQGNHWICCFWRRTIVMPQCQVWFCRSISFVWSLSRISIVYWCNV